MYHKCENDNFIILVMKIKLICDKKKHFCRVNGTFGKKINIGWEN